MTYPLPWIGVQINTSLTLTALLPHLDAALTRVPASQITDPQSPWFGAVVHSDDCRPTPHGTAGLVTTGAYLYIVGGKLPPNTMERLLWDADALQKLQRPNG